MDKKESKVIRLSVLIMSFALIFVYIFWFTVKGEQTAEFIRGLTMSNDEEKIIVTDEDDLIQKNETIEETVDEDNQTEEVLDETPDNDSEEDISSPVVISMGDLNQDDKNNETVSVDTASNQQDEDSLDSFVPSVVNSRIILEWTDIYNWVFDFDDKLALEYQYALKDAKWIHYLFLWDELDEIGLGIKVNQLWWNLFSLNTEMEIINNDLFGEKVIFINLPEYKDTVVLMIVRIDWNYRLVNLDMTTYVESKQYLKNLFTR